MIDENVGPSLYRQVMDSLIGGWQPITNCPSCGSESVSVDTFKETAKCGECPWRGGGAVVWRD